MSKRNVVAEISVVPLGTGSASVSQYVAGCMDVLIGNSGVKHRLTPMGTILEGPLDQVLKITRAMHEVPFKKGALRVVTTLKIDDRCDIKLTMKGKVDRVKKLRPDVNI
ncbi:MAG: MTH1187 family thiamine-binding protein [Dehalococcoidia bacterium]